MKRINQHFHNQLLAAGIANTPALNDAAILAWGINQANIIEHYQSYLANYLGANSIGPIEKHPYLERYAEDFDLNRKMLILGTFPPSTYFNNLGLMGLPNPNIHKNIPLDYFYGNQQTLWQFFGLNPITVNSIRDFLNKNDISISDVYSFVQRKNMIKPNDKEYNNIVLNNNLIKVFDESSMINTIVFTSGKMENILTDVDENVSALGGFMSILHAIIGNGLFPEISGSIDGNGPFYPMVPIGVQQAFQDQNNGIIWWIKFNNKKIRIINVPNPAVGLGLIGSPFHRRYVRFKANQAGIAPPNPDQMRNLNAFMQLHGNIFHHPFTNQYRSDVYQMVLNNTISLII